MDPDAGGIAVAERIWPLVREMSRSLLFDRVQYVIEGEILPKNVAALQEEYPAQIHACFLGYPLIEPAQKLHDIRTHAGHPNDWPQEYTDSALLPIILREIAFSQYLHAECARYHLPYFDMSAQFVPTMDLVVEYVAALRDGHE
jgi:hypothetical protein